MALIAALAIASTGMAVVGQYNQGQAQKNAANYNAQVAAQNKIIGAQQGAAAGEAQRRSSERTIGAMIAGYGASGVQGDSGSPMDVISDSVRMATLDNLSLKYNYALKGLGYDNTAALDSSAASGYSTSGNLKAAGSLLQGVGSAIPKFGSGAGLGTGTGTGAGGGSAGTGFGDAVG